MRRRCFLSISTFALIFPSISAQAAEPGENLLPNGGFSNPDPFHGWVRDFPDEANYRNNSKYLSVGQAAGRRALIMELPPGVAGNEGGKIESVPLPVEPGATYRIEVDCLTWDFSARLHAEVWATDPKPGEKRTLFRRAAAGGRPALVMCHRAQVPPPPSRSRDWVTAGREFTVPATVTVAGQKQKPAYISVKAVAYHGTMDAGKAHFTNFRLRRICGAGEKQADPS